jgi:LysR family nitrogen assimilation transcriptional regulator
MELRQLRYFVGISEAGSVLRASSILHVAQPSLSQQVSALEDEVGAKLFTRSSRGVTLTEAGRVFLGHARVVLADVARAQASVRDAGAILTGEVAIGLPSTIALSATVPILSACRLRMPEVKVRIVEAYSGFLREWLQGGRIDVAILFGDKSEPGMVKRSLLDDRIVLVTSGGDVRLAKKLPLARVAKFPLVLPGREHGLRKLIDDACRPQAIVLDVVAELEALGSVKKAVAAGIGATLLPLGSVAEEVARGQLRASEIENPTIVRRVVCATSVTRPNTPACVAALELVTSTLREMVDGGEWPARWIGPTETR